MKQHASSHRQPAAAAEAHWKVAIEKGDLSLGSQPEQPWLGALRCLSNLVNILGQPFSQSHVKAGAPIVMRLQ